MGNGVYAWGGVRLGKSGCGCGCVGGFGVGAPSLGATERPRCRGSRLRLRHCKFIDSAAPFFVLGGSRRSSLSLSRVRSPTPTPLQCLSPILIPSARPGAQRQMLRIVRGLFDYAKCRFILVACKVAGKNPVRFAVLSLPRAFLHRDKLNHVQHALISPSVCQTKCCDLAFRWAGLSLPALAALARSHATAATLPSLCSWCNNNTPNT